MGHLTLTGPTPEQVHAMFNVNVLASIRISQLVGANMAARGHGHIVVMTSLSARNINRLSAVYGATKHAMSGIAKGLRIELKGQGIKVTDAANFFERESCQIRVDSLNPSWLVFGGGFDQSFIRTFMKRGFDLVCSATILLVSLPVMLLTALAIWIEDRAPIFYSQERVGKNGDTFKVFSALDIGTDE